MDFFTIARKVLVLKLTDWLEKGPGAYTDPRQKMQILLNPPNTSRDRAIVDVASLQSAVSFTRCNKGKAFNILFYMTFVMSGLYYYMTFVMFMVL